MSELMIENVVATVPEDREYGTHTLVTTINNSCNLSCGHCYLQYDGEGNIISDELIEAINQSSVKHVVLAGKEPFVNKKSAEVTRRMIEGAHSTGKTISIISNGTRVPEFLTGDFPKPDFMDISLDGGPESYRSNRGNHYDKAIQGAERVLEFGIPLHILHTVHSGNINNLDDLMTPIEKLECSNLAGALFSPYVVTQNNGVNRVGYLDVERIIGTLSKTDKFMGNEKSYLILDPFTIPGIDQRLPELTEEYGMQGKIMIETREQIAQIMRLSYDGLVLTPQDSVNTALYSQKGRRFDPKTENLDDVLETVRRENVIEMFQPQPENYQLKQQEVK